MGQRSAKDDVLKDANPLLRQGPPWACSLPTRPEWPVMGCWGSLLCLLSAESSVHHPARHCGFWGWNLGVLFSGELCALPPEASPQPQQCIISYHNTEPRNRSEFSKHFQDLQCGKAGPSLGVSLHIVMSYAILHEQPHFFVGKSSVSRRRVFFRST